MSTVPLDGHVCAGFEPVRDVFASVVAESSGTGAAVAVWHDGEWVVDLWGGYADVTRTRPWQRDSIVMPYSVTKPFAAVCVLVLVDRGLVDLDSPLSTYWPGFTAGATVRQVLAHQAALVYGHLLGEVVRSVDGRTIGTFLREEICEPRGLDFHVALLPAELDRVVDLTGYDVDFRRARAVAGLYVELTRGGLLSPSLLAEMTRPHAAGVDRVLGSEASWGLGVGVDPDGFGMGGVGGSYGWWCDPGDYAFAFQTGWIGDPDRGDRIEETVRSVLGLPPG